MTVEIVPNTYSCGLSTFLINGIEADYYDFGECYDACPENAPSYGCGDRVFRRNDVDAEVLNRYHITEEEYEEIVEKLECELHIGRCSLCT